MTDSNEEPRFSWERYEEELRDHVPDSPGSEREPARVLVDAPEAQRDDRSWFAKHRGAELRPIIPPWLRSREQVRDNIRWAIGYARHRAVYHLARTPKYGWKLAVRAPGGASRGLRGWGRWVADAEGRPLRRAAADKGDFDNYKKLTTIRDRRVRARTAATVLLLLGFAAGTAWLALSPLWMRLAALVAALVGLGRAGQPADKPLVERAVIVQDAPKLTSEMVVAALGAIGHGQINQALGRNSRTAISFVAPITREAGRGWRADIDLPPGVTAAEVIDRRDKLAAGLGRPLGCVWPEVVHEIHPGRLMLYVADQDMATARQPAWPLAKTERVDLFRPFPFGTDPRGRTVPLELVYSNFLIGSIPGAGKTFSLRVPLLAAALDPSAEMWVYELKGTGDLEPLTKVCTRYGSGADDDTIEQALFTLRDLRRLCMERAKTIKGLPRSACPENKVTAELAAQRHLKLHLLVCAIDECQELFAHAEYGAEAAELAEKIIKLGRALGVILLLATQRPDAKSLPTGVSANIGTRFCLRVMGQVENDMVLGTSSYRNGLRATMFTKRDKGVGYLVGSGDEAAICRTYKIDGPTAEQICQRAKALREQAGTLAGYAAGETDARARRDTLLEDTLTVTLATEAKVWCEVLLERLKGLRPEVYGHWSRSHLTAALKDHGIATDEQVWAVDPTTGEDANRRGIVREHVAEATRRRARRDPEETT